MVVVSKLIPSYCEDFKVYLLFRSQASESSSSASLLLFILFLNNIIFLDFLCTLCKTYDSALLGFEIYLTFVFRFWLCYGTPQLSLIFKLMFCSIDFGIR